MEFSSFRALISTGRSGFMQLTLSTDNFLKHVQDEAVMNTLRDKLAPKAFE